MNECRNFDEWSQTYADYFPGTRITAEGDLADFHCTYARWNWGDLIAYEMFISHAENVYFQPQQKKRTNHYHYLTLLRNGAFRTRQFGTECTAHGDILTLADGSAPYVARHSPQAHMIFLGLPTGLLQRSVGDLRSACNIPISANFSSGAILKDMVQSLWLRRQEIDNEHAHGIANAIICLLSTLHSPTGNPTSRGIGSTRQSEILDYINANLTDPNLNVESIARFFDISTRYLRTLLRNTGTTPSRYIHELRLQHCMENLSNPLLNHLSVTEIAFRWGFNEISHFSRVFTVRFRESPSKVRRKHIDVPTL